MRSASAAPVRVLVRALVLLLALWVGACRANDDIDTRHPGGTGNQDTASLNSPAQGSGGLPGNSTGGTQLGTTTMNVTLGDDAFSLPMTTTPGGVIAIDVINNGPGEHGLAIEGPGVDRTLAADMKAGESRRVTVDLKAGSYRFYCPEEDHASKGMSATLTVTSPRGHDTLGVVPKQ